MLEADFVKVLTLSSRNFGLENLHVIVDSWIGT